MDNLYETYRKANAEELFPDPRSSSGRSELKQNEKMEGQLTSIYKRALQNFFNEI